MSVVYTSNSSDRAMPGVDFDFRNINITKETRYFNFTISAGSTRSFPLTIIDDNVAEHYSERIYYELGIYDSGRRLYCDYNHFVIEDNDGI